MPKRTSPEFSTILTSNSPARTHAQIDVITRQVVTAYEINDNGLATERIKPRRALTNDRGKRDTINSTSQNHIISDHYIQSILERCVHDVRVLSAPPVAEEHRNLAATKKQGVETFLKAIFHSTEVSQLQTAQAHLNACLLPNARKSSITKFAQFVASHGSNNAVEGNASVNSGVNKRMDAPRDSQGRLLPAFETMRDAFLDLANIASRTLQGRDKEFQNTILDAIKPDLVNGRIRASSFVYKEQRSLRSVEAPLSTHDYEKNFNKGADVAVTTKLTDAKTLHLKNGYGFPRSCTPDPGSRG